MTAEDWLVARARGRPLSPSQRRTVHRMLGMFPDVAFRSASEIAERTGVSQPTVTRLAIALGFAGFAEFRAALRAAVLDGRPGAPPAGPAAVDREIANLGTLRGELGGDRMRTAVALLAGSTPLGVIGLRASAALAHHFGYFARRVLPAVTVCTDAGTAPDTVLELHHGGATALLIFAMPRCPAATVAAARLARQRHLKTVIVADTALVPFAADADVLLAAPAGAGPVADSHAAAVLLATSLLDEIARTDPAGTRRRLAEHEALADRWACDG